MIINVKVNPKAKRTLVKQEGEDFYRVYVTAPPQAGEANKATLEALAEHFKISKSRISILNGEKNRHKVIKIG